MKTESTLTILTVIGVILIYLTTLILAFMLIMTYIFTLLYSKSKKFIRPWKLEV